MALVGGSIAPSTGCLKSACGEVDGAEFVSLGEYECGLGPDGVVPCHWSISFRDDHFTWNYSDIQEQGAYDCDDGEITGHGYDRTYVGSYATDSEILTWQGIEYARQ